MKTISIVENFELKCCLDARGTIWTYSKTYTSGGIDSNWINGFLFSNTKYAGHYTLLNKSDSIEICASQHCLWWTDNDQDLSLARSGAINDALLSCLSFFRDKCKLIDVPPRGQYRHKKYGGDDVWWFMIIAKILSWDRDSKRNICSLRTRQYHVQSNKDHNEHLWHGNASITHKC